ncbi:hypothetical protein NFI96_004563 [Prochilodus magdalenae]|nr:hypothetical protein NFI96_004563 [Prochilodus magdalenae]
MCSPIVSGEAAGGANWQAQVAAPSWGIPMPGAAGAAPGSPMMFPQQPMMSPGMAQSPRKPPPPKDPLADLNIKDFL